MEKDDEIKGEGNSYTTHFRQLDPRIGRWLSIDPKQSAWESPYTSMANNPIMFTDILGDTVKWANDLETSAMRTRVNEMRKVSNSFNTLMNFLEASESVFLVSMNEEMGQNGLFNLYSNGNGTVQLKEGNADETILEEFFHAFQSTVYEHQSESLPDANPMTRTVAQAESEANLYQVFALGELNSDLLGMRGEITDLADDKFFNSLKSNMFLVEPGTEVESEYFSYLELEELLNKGGASAYDGKQEELIPTVYNKIISNTITTSVNAPKAGVEVVAPPKNKL